MVDKFGGLTASEAAVGWPCWGGTAARVTDPPRNHREARERPCRVLARGRRVDSAHDVPRSALAHERGAAISLYPRLGPPPQGRNEWLRRFPARLTQRRGPGLFCVGRDPRR